MTFNISLVLPCYNEEESIPVLCNEFLDLPLEKYNAELILVNNGSNDNTRTISEKIINENKLKNISIKLINLKKNIGYGGAIAEGLKIAKGDYIGWAHADLQTPLVDFLKLYLRIKDKKNILGKGFRINNRGFDGIVSWLHEKLASLILGYQMQEINAQPKIFNRELLHLFTEIPYKWTAIDTYIVYICLYNKVEIETIDVVFNTRKYGHSKWKNNFLTFVNHIFFSTMYLFKLRFFKKL